MKQIVIILSVIILLFSAMTYASAQTNAEDPHLVAAKALREQARTAFSEGDYDGAAAFVAQARTELALIEPSLTTEIQAELTVIEEALPLPAYYIVRYKLDDRDCFWKISDFPFIYNDPEKWELLYEANKDKLVQPDNPHLIHPGMVFVIPSLSGEQRAGTWDGQAGAMVPETAEN